MTSYYVGVSTEDAKTSTLIELLTALRRAADCSQLGPISVHCSSRDSLDSVICLLRDHGSAFDVHVLHSDMSTNERDMVLSSFQHDELLCAGPDGGTPLTISGPGLETSSSFAPSKVLVATDSALQDVGNMLGHAHGKVPLLISFDIPTKKEVLQKRITSAFGSLNKDKRNAAVVHFVVAGEVPNFRLLERFTLPALIHEMPVHVADILQQGVHR